ncbi:MAG TPA: phosphoribosylanthranilate isomerase [Noviherbaspirillum sp.]|nr:phosphoribosylanthranilate isomerase [Noviherbaspirillum sp.]
MSHRTRIKICGLTRVEDVLAATAAGADALGFVFYEKSPRYVGASAAAELIAQVPTFVTTVGLFVNVAQSDAEAIVRQAPVSLLQFHGDETVDQCCAIAHAVNRPFLRAVRMGPGMAGANLLEYEQNYRAASKLFSGLLLDAFVEGYGGGGKVFDWSLIPKELAPRVVLSGGLSVQNATEAVLQVRPHAVDISSGVELSKGIKDPAKIRSFIGAVRQADASLT